MSYEIRHGDCVTPVDSAFGAWLSGLIDGEGCFRIHTGKANRRFRYYTCSFILKLRDDDALVLYEIQRRTGIGTIRRDSWRTGNSKPCIAWHVESKADTAALVELLDRFPLRTRKARDYEVWREAVAYRNEERRGNRWHGPRDPSAMERFAERIREAREYREEVMQCRTT